MADIYAIEPLGLQVETLVELANDNVDEMRRADEGVIRGLLDQYDLAWAVWQDEKWPNGVGYRLVKGYRLLADILAHDRKANGRVGAIPCNDEAMADAMIFHFGDELTAH